MALENITCSTYDGDLRYCTATKTQEIIFDTTQNGDPLKYRANITTTLVQKEGTESGTGTVILPFDIVTACGVVYTEETANYLGVSQTDADISGVETKVVWPQSRDIEFSYENELQAYDPDNESSNRIEEFLYRVGREIGELVLEFVSPKLSNIKDRGEFILDTLNIIDATDGKRFTYDVGARSEFYYSHRISFEVAPGAASFPITLKNRMFLDGGSTRVQNTIKYTVQPPEA